MSASERRKGANGEREVCIMARADFGLDAKRNLDQPREGGHDIDLGPFETEVKRRKRIGNIYDWIEHADIVCMRADGKEWLVTMRWPTFVRLAREEIAEGEKHAT